MSGIIIGTALAGGAMGGVSAYEGHKQRKAQKSAERDARAQAKEESRRQEQQQNALSKKRANRPQFGSTDSSQGIGGTLLSGSGTGLGKSSLLG